MINYDDVTKVYTKDHNLNWPELSDLPYKILVIGGSGSGKTSELLNLIKQQDDDHRSVVDKLIIS